jgi:hypothetical protein
MKGRMGAKREQSGRIGTASSNIGPGLDHLWISLALIELTIKLIWLNPGD